MAKVSSYIEMVMNMMEIGSRGKSLGRGCITAMMVRNIRENGKTIIKMVVALSGTQTEINTSEIFATELNVDKESIIL
jgi:hypothetical protein